MGNQRENVHTQFARAINRFIAHQITKVELYNTFNNLLEVSSEDERNGRMIHKKHIADAQYNLIKMQHIPYSNWLDGLNMLKEQ